MAAAPLAAPDNALAFLLQLEPSGPPIEGNGQTREAMLPPQWSQLKCKLRLIIHQIQGSRCA